MTEVERIERTASSQDFWVLALCVCILAATGAQHLAFWFVLLLINKFTPCPGL